MVNREFIYYEYVECFFNGEFKRYKMSFIRSDNYYLYFKVINKIFILLFDDKWYWLVFYGVESFLYGYYSIVDNKE